MSINERVSKVINELYSGNKRSFSIAAGLSPTVIENIVGIRRGKPSYDVIKKLIYANENISPEWLILGKGDMLMSAKHVDNDSKSGIPLIPVSAFAGVATGEVSVLEFECERYIIPIFKDAEFLIPVKGSSMIPKYSSGDIVACKKLSLTDIFFQWNKVYVIDTDQGVLVKRIHKSSDPEHIKIVSENPQYEPFDLHLSKIYAIAIVIGVVRIE